MPIRSISLKRLFILFAPIIFFAISSCRGDALRDAKAEMENYSWMEGKWNSTENPGIWEIWTADSNGLHGLSYRISGKDSILLEQMHVVPRDTAIYFIADLPENTENVEFLLISREVNRLHFVNHEHDFPKEISYQKIGRNTLRAEVKGDKKALKFLFVKR